MSFICVRVFLVFVPFFSVCFIKRERRPGVGGVGRAWEEKRVRIYCMSCPLPLTHGHLMLRKFTKNYVLALGLRMTCAYKVFLGTDDTVQVTSASFRPYLEGRISLQLCPPGASFPNVIRTHHTLLSLDWRTGLLKSSV